MEWLIWLLVYVVVGIGTSIPSTRFQYRKALKDNKNPVPKGIGVKKLDPAALDELETKRRKKLATEALTTGFWVGVFWPVLLPIFTVLLFVGLVMKGIHQLTIKPEDQPFVSEKQMRKAQAIIDKYNLEQKNQFEKELGD